MSCTAATAMVRIVPVRDRAAGVADVMLLVDRPAYSDMNELERDALIDHELTHLEPIMDDETRSVVFDVAGRPRVRIRKHDRQYGWFDEVASRWGPNSVEARQARKLVDEAGQLYLDLGANAIKEAG